MAYTLLKNGDYVVNRATYEYMCDSLEDLYKIPGRQISTGSTAMVIDGSELKLYIANSQDKWVEVTDGTSGGSSSGSSTYELTKAKIIAALEYTPMDENNFSKEKILALLGDSVQTKEAAAQFDNEVSNSIDEISDEIDKINDTLDNMGVGGSSKKWTKIIEKTLDTAVTTVEFTKDDSENDLNLSDIYCEFEFAAGSKSNSVKIFINDFIVGYLYNGIATSKSISSFKAQIDGGLCFSQQTTPTTVTSTTSQTITSYGNMLKGEASTITSISISNATGATIPVGSIIRIYGK